MKASTTLSTRLGSLTGLRVLRHWRMALLIAFLVAYVGVFDALVHVVGVAAGAIVMLPIALAGWWYGGRAAVAVGVFSGLCNLGLDVTLNGASLGEAARMSVFATVAFAAVGALIGSGQTTRRHLAKLTSTDTLTGVMNRPAFVSLIDAELRRDRTRRRDAVTIEIVDFRAATDMFGYDAGAELLSAIARRLETAAPAGSRIARLNSGAFSLITPDRDPDAAALAARFLIAFAEPFSAGDAAIQLDAIVGIAHHPEHGSTARVLQRRAEAAIDDARRRRERWGLATPEDRDKGQGQSRLELLSGLGRAIDNGELRLHYQPIVDLKTGALEGLEALVRWQHPVRGLVPPLDFIPLAERSGLIVALTEWVIDEALRQSREWADRSLRLQVAVNISARTLGRSSSLPQVVSRLLRKHGVAPARLCLEVTETDVMADPEHCAKVLRELKTLGIRIEVDDFGTGYSSLAYLQRLPLDAVKIDRSFIGTLTTEIGTAAIVRASIDLSHSLGFDVIAEGVEDEVALERLATMGCDAVQGYLIARPMPGVDVPEWHADFERTHRAQDPLPAKPAGPGRSGAVGAPLPPIVEHERTPGPVPHAQTPKGLRVVRAATAREALRIRNDGRYQLTA